MSTARRSLYTLAVLSIAVIRPCAYAAGPPPLDAPKPQASAPPHVAPPSSLSSSIGVTVVAGNNQSMVQQANDEQDCYVWAVDQTGTNPIEKASRPPPQSASVEPVPGAIVLAGGAISSSSSHRKQAARMAEQSQAELSAFNRAFAACMSGRGYSVR